METHHNLFKEKVGDLLLSDYMNLAYTLTPVILFTLIPESSHLIQDPELARHTYATLETQRGNLFTAGSTVGLLVYGLINKKISERNSTKNRRK